MSVDICGFVHFNSCVVFDCLSLVSSSSVDGHFNCYEFFAVKNGDASAFLCTHGRVFLG